MYYVQIDSKDHAYYVHVMASSVDEAKELAIKAVRERQSFTYPTELAGDLFVWHTGASREASVLAILRDEDNVVSL